MLRRVGNTHAFARGRSGASMTPTHLAMVRACGTFYVDRRRFATLMLSSTAATPTSAAVLMSQRTLFWPGQSGEGFLHHFTPSSNHTKVMSPLASLRPPAPPSASDARPFGSLNRTNSIRRYVNINAAGSVLSASDSKGKAASSSASPASPSTAAMVPAPPRMELSRLLQRHNSRSSCASTSATASSKELGGAHRERDLPLQQRAAGNPTVAKAQAAIAAATCRANTAALLSTSNSLCARPETAAGAAGSPIHESEAAASQASRASGSSGGSRHHVEVYREHCTIGWSPEKFYQVVADVGQYSAFLPWCAGSEVHTTRQVRVPRGVGRLDASVAAASPSTGGSEAAEAQLVDAVEMITTLSIGFSFLKEEYKSRVTLYPCRKIVAALYEDEDADGEVALQKMSGRRSAPAASPLDRNSATGTGGGGGDGLVLSFFKKAASSAGAAAKRSILQHLRCEWELSPVEGKPNAVEVLFFVSFEFRNPMHRHLVMSNVVGLMTRSFERRCESLYGPPSATKVSLPVLS
ncbi:hypothetical protein LSCM1_05754 [Leishmania martiniquensis]|uniref:Coenzyme Q-binding protein COQ10 START domain-containing protein n=1 Tax=Leishmania martiniquensis TaxID=1580590 RepID=A0A836GXN5_9TRYP|nr:hypothetical protein LSCM1_05754 [Leishmania martiniquensis]